MDDKAFDFYLDKKYDSALIYYQKIIKKKNWSSDPYYLNQIGDCFFYLGRNEQAKENYLQSLKDTSEAGPYAPQRGSCHTTLQTSISPKINMIVPYISFGLQKTSGRISEFVLRVNSKG